MCVILNALQTHKLSYLKGKEINPLKLNNCSHISLVTLSCLSGGHKHNLGQTNKRWVGPLEIPQLLPHKLSDTLGFVRRPQTQHCSNKQTNTGFNSLKLHNCSIPSLVRFSCLSGGHKHNLGQTKN